MDQRVWSSSRDIRIALARLELRADLLLEVVRAGHLARSTRTENDAPNAAGVYQWNEMVRVMREQLVAVGWERRNDDGLPTIVNPVTGIGLAVSSGNSSTGIAHQVPSTKYHKGPGTVERVTSNAELMLPFPDLAPSVRRNREKGSISTWTLLFFTDDHEVRAELSLPVMIDGSGQINGWSDRIILPATPLDGDGSRTIPEPDFGPDIDIEIRRRA